MKKIYSNLSVLANKFFLFKRFPVLKEVVKFGIVGATNIFVDVVVYWLLTRYAGIYYLAAATISFLAANIWSYFWNRRWTFHDHNRAVIRQYFKFLAANIIAILLNLLLLFVFVDFFNFNDLISKIIASIAVGLVNFIINKIWAFGEKTVQADNVV